jgi:lysozyme family protein
MGDGMSWRVAKSLEKLRTQVNASAPLRSKASDGSIGDAAHASRASDHNPYIKDKNGVGVVRAIDITHDPDGGFDSYDFAEHLRKTGDKRITYIISNKKIANPGQAWRKYTGTNPHDHHVHVSVSETPALYDDASEWDIGARPKGAVAQIVGKIVDVISPPPAILKVGSKGAAVKELQTLLGIAADGAFGPFTEKAVRAFQAANGLAVDGMAGPYTLSKLKEAKKPADIFDRVMVWVFEDEGGVTISPDEPGGISTFGVSRTSYSEYMGRPVSVESMKVLTRSEATKFYRDKFWNVIATDKPAGLRYAAFDWAINSGPKFVNQRLPNDPTIDALCDDRLSYLRTLTTWPKYGKGWTSRVERVRERAKQL